MKPSRYVSLVMALVMLISLCLVPALVVHGQDTSTDDELAIDEGATDGTILDCSDEQAIIARLSIQEYAKLLDDMQSLRINDRWWDALFQAVGAVNLTPSCAGETRWNMLLGLVLIVAGTDLSYSDRDYANELAGNVFGDVVDDVETWSESLEESK